MIETSIGIPVYRKTVSNYFRKLVNRFFKILPIREDGEETLPIYIKSLQKEILGCKRIIDSLDYDPDILTLVSILQYMLETPDMPIEDIKREVFRAIAICNRIKDEFDTEEVPPYGYLENLSK